MTKLREISAELFVMAAIGLALGLIGPFGSFAMPVVARVIDWMALALLGYAFFRPVIAAGDALSAQAGVPRALALALACAIAALPMAAIACWMAVGFRFARVDATGMAETYPYVFIVGGIATAIQVLLFRDRPAPAAAPSPTETPSVAPPPPASPVPAPSSIAYRRRWDANCSAWRWSRAHTMRGSTLILMRLRDAIAELDGIEGAGVHRSWWVAKAAVAEVLRRDRATALRLVNGLEVPVARNALPVLRGRGWL